MINAFKRTIRYGWLGFFRDGGLAAATVFILVITIALISSIFILKDVSQFLISSLQEKVDISVYLKKDLTEDQILDIKDELAEIPEVKEIKYVSREEALESFTQKYKDNAILIESIDEVGENPFLAALNIKAYEASQYTAIASFLESADFKDSVEKVDYYQRKSVIDRIFNLTSIAKKAGISLAVILAIITILVTFNTIRLAIYNNREEVKIQRLVGASNWFIRGPFIAQGVISGVFSALICLFIFSMICWWISPRVSFFFPDLNVFGILKGNILALFLIQLATGMGLGVFSSVIAIRRYLRV